MKASKARFKHSISFMSIIDLLAILPFYLAFILADNLMAMRILRLFRLLRLFKLNRYTSAMNSIKDILTRKAPQLLSSMFAVFLLMLLASLLVHAAENGAQPDVFQNAFSGLWWAVATVTTVGYGDIYPITIMGKFFGAMIALLGIGLVAVPTGIISAGFVESMTEQKKAEEAEKEAHEEKHFCPYCGKKIV
jgi:voltage-gated potassium channel